MGGCGVLCAPPKGLVPLVKTVSQVAARLGGCPKAPSWQGLISIAPGEVRGVTSPLDKGKGVDFQRFRFPYPKKESADRRGPWSIKGGLDKGG